MIGTSGWDSLMLSVRATPDGGWELRVGAIFVAALVWLARKLVVWCREDDESKRSV